MTKEEIKKLMIEKNFKQMEYTSKEKIEILAEGEYKGYQFYVLNFGAYPTAYVEIPKTSKLFNKHYLEYSSMDIDIEVHGGITFSADHLQNIRKDTWIIGWDYAHGGDYLGFLDILPDDLKLSEGMEKKWTTEEILENVFNVIEQVIEVG